MSALGVNTANRTNNPLESYNRTFGEKFAGAHPTLFAFMDTAKAEALRYVRMIELIKKGLEEAPAHADYVEVELPVEYLAFE
ncbi:hypothetical protein DVH05_007196 [Phytophthora capsici]|nr:hypothetical protein DVH05_007196 [Phytophthora capsici]